MPLDGSLQSMVNDRRPLALPTRRWRTSAKYASGTAPFVSISTKRSGSANRASMSSSIPSCSNGSPPVSVTHEAGEASTNETISRTDIIWAGASARFAHTVSQYAHASVQPRNRTNAASLPAWVPSPFTLMKCSTTGNTRSNCTVAGIALALAIDGAVAGSLVHIDLAHGQPTLLESLAEPARKILRRGAEGHD